MALMQHYGAPTRLIDFTYSIQVAAYFATETTTGDSIVWAIDGPWALNRAAELLRNSGKNGPDIDRIVGPFREGDEAVVASLVFAAPYVCCAWPINAFYLNERLRTQQGAFLIAGDVGRPFEENLMALGPGSDEHMLRIVIPWDLGRQMPRRLFSISISRTTLFPGIDGWAQSLGIWNPAFDPIDWSRKT
jgi:hypothetical protein